jgi:hypothetical protein
MPTGYQAGGSFQLIQLVHDRYNQHMKKTLGSFAHFSKSLHGAFYLSR